ncbi:MAG TPA: hypothetical protein VNF45_08735 [Candidatus Binataceae bacterium]|nr:hypothetical protein [Candidatus Binataceae bacterium]
MKAISVRTPDTEWTSAAGVFGERAINNGKPLVQLKILSDRRPEGGGLAYMLKFSPPAGKLIKLVAVAQSDEHVYVLEGGYCNRAGEQLRFPGDYALNPEGHPHSAFIGVETVGMAVYAGEPDKVVELEVIDPIS